MTQTRHAILVMSAGVFLLALNDVMGKLLVERFSPFQILFVRSLVSLPMIAAIVLIKQGTSGFSTHTPGLHLVRGLIMVVATFAFITSLGVLPLATATALIFTAPLMVAALAVVILRERLTRVRLGAIGAGFAGALIIVRPGASALEPAAGWALLAALGNALLMLTARRIHARESFWTMLFYLSLFPAVMSVFVLAGDWPQASLHDQALFFGMAVCGTAGIALITQAFRIGDASAIAPFDYAMLIWASLWGFVIWGVVPDHFTLAGGLIIAAGGIVLFRHEGQKVSQIQP